MLGINMSDVIQVLRNTQSYIIAIIVAIVLAIIAIVACFKLDKPIRFLIRMNAVLAVVVVVAIVANLLCTGPLSTLLSLRSNAAGRGTISNETLTNALSTSMKIAEEGIVLLENEDNVLPLNNTSNLNVFGCASVNPVYGGTGSGSLSDAYEIVSLLQGLEDANFNLNTQLSDFYNAYCEAHPVGRGEWTLREPPVDTYSVDMLDSAKAFSDTALIVFSRVGGEGNDLPTDLTTHLYTNNSDEYEDFPAGTHYLELSQTEKNLVNMVCENFDNVVVIYNGANTLELDFVRDYEQIKGVVWCPGTGQNGFEALGKILSGEVNPSGKSTDTFVTDLTATPYWNNFGENAYDNMNEFQISESDPFVPGAVPHFVNYVEGIYVGYKFYETAAEEGLIDYDSTVLYPFGHGLSYTSFTQEMGTISETDGTISFDVTITNTGSVAGKDVVEVYYTPPYTNGGIEKASVNL